MVAASSAPSQGSGAPAKVLEEGNALAAFNVRFRQQGEEKDAKERDAKASHKAAGKAALKKMVAERNERVATRKTANREAEKAAEQDMLNALSGESWGRVVTLMDVSGAEKAGAEKEEKKGGKGGNEKAASTEERKKAVGGVDDTIRLKDVSWGTRRSGILTEFDNHALATLWVHLDSHLKSPCLHSLLTNSHTHFHTNTASCA